MSDPYDTPTHKTSSVLGPTLKFKGDLVAEEDLLIQGEVEGSIRHSSSLTIGEGGFVKADVSAEYIAVEGRVEGDLKGTKSVKVRVTAEIDGNIVSPKVALVEGAQFNGKIDMDSDPAAAGQSPTKRNEAAKSEAVSSDEAPKPPKSKSAAAKKPRRDEKKPADAA